MIKKSISTYPTIDEAKLNNPNTKPSLVHQKLQFCDWEPCVALQEALHKFLPDNTKRGEEIKFYIETKAAHSRATRHFLVQMLYCPFCGTRLKDNKDIIEWVDKFSRNRPSSDS